MTDPTDGADSTDGTDSPDPADALEDSTSHRWGTGWAVGTRDDVAALVEDGVIASPDDYDHFESFEDLAAFVLGRGPHLDRPGFQPAQQDRERVSGATPTPIDWQRARETYDCLAEPSD